MAESRVVPDGRPVAVIASAGRPALLADAMRDVEGLEGEVGRIVAVPSDADLPPDARLRDGWTVVTGALGSSAQRNAALEAVEDGAVVFFFDDDSVVRSDYVQNALAFFAQHPEVVALTGRVLLDGSVTGEIPVEDAALAVARSWTDARSGAWTRSRELYGCNFAVRTAAVPRLRFDERLPLYSWLEDHDFARRLMAYGVLARVEDCVVVHRAAASGGREAHVRLGYSQVMNPVYLWRKGSFPLWLMATEMGKRVAKNLLRAAAGRQHRWRRRRLAGNAMAARDVLRGRITPERIVDL